MANGKFIAYYRVSTARQGQSGLGLEAQQESVRAHLQTASGQLVGHFEEVETGKGADALNRRPQLKAALDDCKRLGATLIIAKLDRLARNVHFVSGLMESKVRFVACDMPEANELTIHIMAAFAEHEAKRISQRTKDALTIAKARGVQLGRAGMSNLRPNIEKRQQAADAFAEKCMPVISAFQSQGLSQRKIVDELNRIGVTTSAGRPWQLTQLQRIISRASKLLNEQGKQQ